MRIVGVSFNSFITSKVGADGIGLYTLIMSVYGFFGNGRVVGRASRVDTALRRGARPGASVCRAATLPYLGGQLRARGSDRTRGRRGFYFDKAFAGRALRGFTAAARDEYAVHRVVERSVRIFHRGAKGVEKCRGADIRAAVQDIRLGLSAALHTAGRYRICLYRVGRRR